MFNSGSLSTTPQTLIQGTPNPSPDIIRFQDLQRRGPGCRGPGQVLERNKPFSPWADKGYLSIRGSS